MKVGELTIREISLSMSCSFGEFFVFEFLSVSCLLVNCLSVSCGVSYLMESFVRDQ